jgi:hypothetical protein
MPSHHAGVIVDARAETDGDPDLDDLAPVWPGAAMPEKRSGLAESAGLRVRRGRSGAHGATGPPPDLA